MRVAVTGPTGHLGGNLVRTLLAHGHEVTALVFKDGPALDGLTVHKVPGNVLDEASLRRAFDGAEIVFHLAGAITLGRDRKGHARRINVGGVQNVIAACLHCRVRRLIHFSSVHALSPYPIAESVHEGRGPAIAKHLPAYDRSKAEGEALIMAAARKGLDAVVLNPTGVVGPLDYERSRMGRVLLDLYYRRMPALVAGGFNWVDVRDVSTSAIAAVEQGVTGERYLLAGHWHSVRQVAEIVHAVTGVSAPRFVMPMWAARAAAVFPTLYGDVTGRESRFNQASLHALRHHQHVDYRKAAAALGHAPRPLRDTIQDTFAWFRQAGFLKDAAAVDTPSLPV